MGCCAGRSHWPATVSYTHLDVYKRQAYNGGSDIELFKTGSTSFTLCWGTSTQLVNQATLDENAITTLSLPCLLYTSRCVSETGTKLLAPIRLFAPMVMGPSTLQPVPMSTLSPMVGWR